MSRNWDNMGISWALENVSERISTNNSDKRTLGQCPIMVPTDLDKFRAEFGDAAILGIFNGTSIRVMCQDIGRRGIKGKQTLDQMKEACYNRVKGVRNSAVAVTKVVEVKVYPLPNGETYKGTSLEEYQGQYMAALVDAGVPAEAARGIALKQSL